MVLYGNTADGKKVRLISSSGQSQGSVNKSGINDLRNIKPSSGTGGAAMARWNDAEMNALAKLNHDSYDVNHNDYQSFSLNIQTSIKMCKYCRKRIMYWKNQLEYDWGKNVSVNIST